MSDPVQTLTAKEKQLEAQRRWREKNRERISAYNRAYRNADPEREAKRQKEYHAEYRTRQEVQYETWVRNLRRNYRMTPSEFNALWDAQDGCCAICENRMQPRGRDKTAVAVDHNHATGEVRGLLCRGCNHGIGSLRDDPAILLKAVEYLNAFGNYAHLRKALK